MKSLHGVAGLAIPDEVGVLGIKIHGITVTKAADFIVACHTHVLQSLGIISPVRIRDAVFIQGICVALVAGRATLKRGRSIGSRIAERVFITIVGHEGRLVARAAAACVGQVHGVMIAVVIGVVAARSQTISDHLGRFSGMTVSTVRSVRQ
jgi:hypothetical protein